MRLNFALEKTEEQREFGTSPLAISSSRSTSPAQCAYVDPPKVPCELRNISTELRNISTAEDPNVPISHDYRGSTNFNFEVHPLSYPNTLRHSPLPSTPTTKLFKPHFEPIRRKKGGKLDTVKQCLQITPIINSK